jgi:hypothetical protein
VRSDRQLDNAPADDLFLRMHSLRDFEHVSKVIPVDRYLVCSFRMQNSKSSPDFDLIVGANASEGPNDTPLRVFSPEVVVEDRKERARLESHGRGRPTAGKQERYKYESGDGSKCSSYFCTPCELRNRADEELPRDIVLRLDTKQKYFFTSTTAAVMPSEDTKVRGIRAREPRNLY